MVLILLILLRYALMPLRFSECVFESSEPYPEHLLKMKRPEAQDNTLRISLNKGGAGETLIAMATITMEDITNMVSYHITEIYLLPTSLLNSMYNDSVHSL